MFICFLLSFFMCIFCCCCSLCLYFVFFLCLSLSVSVSGPCSPVWNLPASGRLDNYITSRLQQCLSWPFYRLHFIYCSRLDDSTVFQGWLQSSWQTHTRWRKVCWLLCPPQPHFVLRMRASFWVWGNGVDDGVQGLQTRKVFSILDSYFIFLLLME